MSPRGGRFGGLDGLRAIAVGMVLVYHLFPKALPGGFLGVDVFFVMSGFLITSLLLRELEGTGRIDLLAFWRRRARRLLPAVALVVLVSTSLALAASRDLLVGVAQQIAGALLFVSNWVFIANGSDYFARDAPELFRNFWSLALEEQFYIVLPLIAVLVFRLRSRLTWAIPLAALGVGSAFLMAALANAGAEPTRIYFGSDSHSFGLFLGAAMAVLLSARAQRTLSRAGQVASVSVAVAGFAVLGYLAFALQEASEASFAWGFQLATVAALGVVWAVTREGAIVGRLLDVAPLRWVGERSYGIYLWHWPLLVITVSVATSAGFGNSWIPPVIALALTILFAALSYRFVEQPVRRVGLRGALIRWFSPRNYTPRRKRVSIGLAAVLAVTFPLTGVAVAIAPERTSSADSILRGQKQLEADKSAAGDQDPEGSDHGATGDAEPGSDSAGAEQGAAPAATFEGRDITAVGDSVMLASYPELTEAFPGIEVDAAVSRGIWAGVEILQDMAARGALRSVIVVGLGTNGPVEPEALTALREVAGSRPIVFVDAHAERDWIPGVNEELNAFAAANRGVVVAKWDASVAGTPEFLAEDGIHPGPEGGEVYAGAIRAALDELLSPAEATGWGVGRR
ncbi:peptidoglycan/LPS O-acetylase OafA/YrhL [Leucobacter komagatae]|uniref:Peptidoglycan/LPS O-acetylase OafA/YrhL n=1 Tax=Leucobacter komagatae TaxID=55969 RepID=A0A542XY22_9MICO|nr:peptidoglycan/LPS O-acetylase OafA/YrhL [Leucobacter komagatae]